MSTASFYPIIQFNPIAIDFGFATVYWYSILYVLGCLISGQFAYYHAGRIHFDLTKAQILDLQLALLPAIIIGARLGELILYYHFYRIAEPNIIYLLLSTKIPGMSFYGGLIGVLSTLKYCSYKLKKSWIELVDFVSPCVPIALALGRLGNFINGELWGRPTSMPWAMIFPRVDYCPRHPSQLYELMLEGIVLFMILWWFSKKTRPQGAVSGVFATCYALARFFVEFFREPHALIGLVGFDWLTVNQLFAIILLGVGLLLLQNAYVSKTQNS